MESFLSELRRARGYLTRLVARMGSAVVLVPIADVDWVDARGNYARLHVGSETHLVREPLHSLAGRLDPERFARIHRSIIVNLERIVTVEPYFHGEYTTQRR